MVDTRSRRNRGATVFGRERVLPVIDFVDESLDGAGATRRVDASHDHGAEAGVYEDPIEQHLATETTVVVCEEMPRVTLARSAL